MIVQENRTFDNLFNGFPGADTAQTGYDHTGQLRTLIPVPLVGTGDWSHSQGNCFKAYDNGKMDGFDLDKQIGLQPPPTNYSYVQQSDLTTYWGFASKYTLADRMFSSNCGSSFPAHQYLIAGQTGSEITPHSKPWGCDSLQQPECFDYTTLGDEMDAAGVSWRFYAHGVDINTPSQYDGFLAYDAIRHIRYGPDWTANHVAIPETTILSDIKNGTLAQVSWVTPACNTSDHHGCGPMSKAAGPAWVGGIVNAIGASQYWNTTAIFIVWDDWGGWYDHVAPQHIYKDGLGFRVPLIVVSPYARHSYVSHVNHEFGSILRYVEETFGLPTLFQRDSYSDDLLDCFDYTQSPTPLLRVHTPPLQAVRTFGAPDGDDDN